MSTVNWCEEDYVHSAHVAEWYNTWSSATIVLAGVLGAMLHPPADRSVFHLLTVVGVGSVLFHATLTAWAQMLDEIPMLLVVLHLMSNICVPLQERERLTRRFGVALSLIMMVTAHWKNVFGTLEFYMFQAFFGLLSTSFALYTGLMWYHADIRLGQEAKRSFGRGATLFLAGFIMWLTEQCFCSYINSHAIPVQLHALWHILSAAGTYHLCVYSMLIRNAGRKLRHVKGVH
jgi:dihydroceramidase